MIKVLNMHVENNTIKAVVDKDNATFTLTFYWERHWQRGDRAPRVAKCTVSTTSTERVVIMLGLTPERSRQLYRDGLVSQQLVGEMWRAVQHYLHESSNNVGRHNTTWVPKALEFITKDDKFIEALERGEIQIGK